MTSAVSAPSAAIDVPLAIEKVEPVSPLLGAAFLDQNRLIPLRLEGRTLVIASWLTLDELDVQAFDDLMLLTGATAIRLETGPEQPIRQAIQRVYARSTTTAQGVVERLTDRAASAATPRTASLDDLVHLANEAPVIRLVNLLLLEAVACRASDIHLEHTANGLLVRYRIDGILQPAPSPPANLSAAVISRIKIMAEMDIAERRLPQDGRVRLQLQEQAVDVRVSIVPSLDGESVVLRLLANEHQRVTLTNLGMPDDIRSPFEHALSSPQGMVLTTGPTGSGKTTTLYASVDHIRTGKEKILTVEDPVEYQLDGVTQMPVNERIGLTFATALRALLRQDPDVLLVGEIRDTATAEIAVQAALTGHLVLSTLHTNDAASALTRLLDLGVAPYLIASTVEVVLAQRLVRSVCTACSSVTRPNPAEEALLRGDDVEREITLGRGCAACRNTGYRGRIGIYELLSINDELRTLVAERRPVWAMREAAGRAGMRSLRQAGLDLVIAGRTTPEEVLRVTRSEG